MAAPYDTIALDPLTNDSFVTPNGDIATRSGAAAVAQDMTTACALVRGEYIYNINDGVPYRSIFGYTVSLAVLKSDYVSAASTIPGLAPNSVVCYIKAVQDRNVAGQVQGKLPASSTPVVASIGGAPVPTQPVVLISESGQILTSEGGSKLTP